MELAQHPINPAKPSVVHMDYASPTYGGYVRLCSPDPWSGGEYYQIPGKSGRGCVWRKKNARNLKKRGRGGGGFQPFPASQRNAGHAVVSQGERGTPLWGRETGTHMHWVSRLRLSSARRLHKRGDTQNTYIYRGIKKVITMKMTILAFRFRGANPQKWTQKPWIKLTKF